MMGFRRDVIRFTKQLQGQPFADRRWRPLLLEQHIPAHDRDDEWPAAEQARGPTVKAVRVMHMHDIGPAAAQKAHKPDNPKKMAQRFAADPAATSCERPPPAAIGESRIEAGDQLGDARDATPARRWRY